MRRGCRSAPAGHVRSSQLRGMLSQVGFDVSEEELAQTLLDLSRAPPPGVPAAASSSSSSSSSSSGGASAASVARAAAPLNFRDFVRLTHLVDELKALKIVRAQELQQELAVSRYDPHPHPRRRRHHTGTGDGPQRNAHALM